MPRLVLVILLFSISVLFFMGKGSFLIAGYNTASKAEKAKYDEKKVCRFTGMTILMCALGLLASTLNENLVWVEFSLYIVGIVIGIVGTNFFSKKKVDDINETEIKPDDNKAFKIVKIGSLVFTLIILAGAGGLLFAGDVSVSVGKNAVEVNAFMAAGSTVNIQI